MELNELNGLLEAKALSEQLMRHYSVQMKFLERYYSEEYKIKVSIIIDAYADTSYFSPRDGKIAISAKNMLIIMRQLPHLKHKMFYSLLLHELGHAIYTPAHKWERAYSGFLNILEDNRIESHISKWNGSTNFRMLRYIFQDKVLDVKQFEEMLTNPQAPREQRALHIALALLRTIKPQPYIDVVCSLNNNVPRVAKLQKLNREFQDTIMFGNIVADPMYKHLPEVYENPKYINHYALEFERCDKEYSFRAQQMLDLVDRVKSICLELAGEFDLPKQEQQGKGNPQKSCNGGDGPKQKQETQEQSPSDSQDNSDNKEDSEQDTEDTEDTEDNEQQAQGSQDNEQDTEDTEEDDTDADSDTAEDSEEDELDQLEKAIQDAMYEDKQIASRVGKDYGAITNFERNVEDYQKVNISAFTTVRRRGIKGHAKTPSVSGSMRDFNLRRYARRKFDNSPIPKYFDRRNEETRGGSNPAIMFYLDISGSMSGYRIQTLLSYVRSFYDRLHNSVDIRIFAFGRFTYQLTRNELSLSFLQRRLEGSTNPSYIPPKSNEEIVIITDGEWGVDVPDVYRRRAHFILVDTNGRPRGFNLCRNVYPVSSHNLVKTLEQATSSLIAKLKR